MPRKKAVRSEDDLFVNDEALADQEERELARAMENRGYMSLSEGSYRSSSRQLSDEVSELY